jgi:hypothetical protein
MDDAGAALGWLAAARKTLQELEAVPVAAGSRKLEAALDLLPSLRRAVMLTEEAGPGSSVAGFEAASACWSAAQELAGVVKAGEAADLGELAHAGWLIGRAHAIAQHKVSMVRDHKGRPLTNDPATSNAARARQLKTERTERTSGQIQTLMRAEGRVMTSREVRKAIKVVPGQ